MPIWITRKAPPPTNPLDVLAWALEAAQQALAYLRALVLLDPDTRRERSDLAERAVLFTSAVVTSAGVTSLATLVPAMITETYTTALIISGPLSGPGRWRIDGQSPIPASVLPAAGMPIPAGATLTLVGRLNIQNFLVTAEAANVDLSITLFK